MAIYGKYSTSPQLAHMYASPNYLGHPFSSVHRIKLMRRMIEDAQANGYVRIIIVVDLGGLDILA